MANEDTNAIIRAFLVAQTALAAVVDERIMTPRLAEDPRIRLLGSSPGAEYRRRTSRDL